MLRVGAFVSEWSANGGNSNNAMNVNSDGGINNNNANNANGLAPDCYYFYFRLYINDFAR